MGKRQTSRQQRRQSPDMRSALPRKSPSPPKPRPTPSRTQKAKDKRGIPRLSGQEDLPALFGEEEERLNFAEALTPTLNDDAFSEALREKKAGAGTGTSRSMAEALKHYPAPQARLDLHGCTAPEAETKTEVFILSARHQRMLTLRIITGKGLHSPDNLPVLPDVVERTLIELRRKGVVLAFQWEKKEKLKSGAVLVFLP